MRYPKTIVLDIDGTLTNSQKELTPRNRDILLRIQQLGTRIVLASGRPTYGIVPLERELRLAEYGGYILSYNGGTIIDCRSGEAIYETVLPESVLSPIYEYATKVGCVALSYDGEYIISQDCDDKYLLIEANLNKMKCRRVDDFVAEASLKLRPKALAVGDPDRVVELESRLKEAIGDRINIFRSEPFFLELVPLGIDKAQSLARLLEHLGEEREDMMAFGDGYNDLSMIEFAGFGVAMGNGQECVKAAADQIIATNDEDGVAQYLEKLFESLI